MQILHCLIIVIFSYFVLEIIFSMFTIDKKKYELNGINITNTIIFLFHFLIFITLYCPLVSTFHVDLLHVLYVCILYTS